MKSGGGAGFSFADHLKIKLIQLSGGDFDIGQFCAGNMDADFGDLRIFDIGGIFFHTQTAGAVHFPLAAEPGCRQLFRGEFFEHPVFRFHTSFAHSQ